MKIKDLVKLLFSEQLEKEVDSKAILAMQFPTEDGQSVLECETLEVGQPVSLIDVDGNKAIPEDGDYEITDETGSTSIVTIKSGTIEAVAPGEAEADQESPNEMANDKDKEDPIENHPLVKEAKQKLDLARAKAKVESAKAEVDSLKGPKKGDAPVEENPEAKPAGAENPDEAKDKGPAPPKKTSVVPKKMARKMSTQKPGESEPKAPGEKGGPQIEDKKAEATKPQEATKATAKEGSVGNKYTAVGLSAAEKLRKEMEPEVVETDVKLSADEELKLLKAELSLQKEKMKVLLSESKPLKVAQTTVMDKVQEGDDKLSKADFIKKHILGREDI